MTNSQPKMWRTWLIDNMGAEDIIHGAPTATTLVVDAQALDELSRENAKLKAELEERRIATPTMEAVHMLNGKLNLRDKQLVLAKIVLNVECGNKCAGMSPCNARLALEGIEAMETDHAT